MPETVQGDFERILRTLCDHGVDFIVVGGVAAVLEGAPVVTFDLDVVHSRKAGNIDRLLKALESLDATPDASHLAAPGHQLLGARFGPLDVLGSIGRSSGYDELLPHTFELELGGGLRVRVLNLETVIALKEEVGDEKDLATLPILRRTLAEKRRARPDH